MRATLVRKPGAWRASAALAIVAAALAPDAAPARTDTTARADVVPIDPADVTDTWGNPAG